MISVCLSDPQPIVQEGLKSVLEACEDIEFVERRRLIGRGEFRNREAPADDSCCRPRLRNAQVDRVGGAGSWELPSDRSRSLGGGDFRCRMLSRPEGRGARHRQENVPDQRLARMFAGGLSQTIMDRESVSQQGFPAGPAAQPALDTARTGSRRSSRQRFEEPGDRRGSQHRHGKRSRST